MSGYDCIVIGAGHNGMVCALEIARLGNKVLLLEKNDAVGGICAQRVIGDGFAVPGLLHDTHGLNPRVITSLRLERHGLRLRDPEPVLAILPDGAKFALPPEADGNAPQELVTAYRGWYEQVESLKGLVRGVAERPPPPVHAESLGDFFSIASLALRVRALGKRRMTELMRIAPMCVADWLDEFFPHRGHAEALMAPALLGNFQGPWSAGTAFNLLLNESLKSREVIGGPAALVRALKAACDVAGVVTRTSEPVSEITVKDGRATGVVIESREHLSARHVVAAINPRTLFLDLVPPRQLEARVENQASAIRTRGTLAKVHLGIRQAAIEFTHSRYRLCTGGTNELEKAFDATKYGDIADKLLLDIVVPTLDTPGLAPDGHHLLSVMVGYVPYALRGGWNDAARERLLDAVIQRCEEAFPGLRDSLVCHECLAPPDLEAQYGLPEGQVHHVEPALDQMLGMRPSIALAGYRTPIENLHLGGSGSHPTGGVTGLPGWLAAKSLR